MKRKIIAEFDSVDSAESAARYIKSNTEGIANIKITDISYNFDNLNYVENIYGVSYLNGSDIVLPTAYNFQNVSDTNRNLSTNRTAKLEIICEQESLQQVSNKLTSLGGLKIKKS